MASYLMEFSVRGPVAVLSHLELMKIFRQAFRRSGLPVAFSEGFNPHVKLSFAIAKSVGLESEGEILEVETREEIDPVAFLERINGVLPGGLKILRIQDRGDQRKSLSALLKQARYRLLCPDCADCTADLMAALEVPAILVEVRSKKSVGVKDLKEYVVSASPVEGGIEVTVCAGSEKNLRIDYLAKYLGDVTGKPLQVVRTRLFGESGPLADSVPPASERS